tara:strand:- start:2287 stop:2820 length:534 start_codon:yes stop_codon:yes gene_type:complete
MNSDKNIIIPDVKILSSNIFNDNRGYFFESFNQKKFNLLNIETNQFLQDNESMSKFGVLRGIHFQSAPFEQSKLVRVVSGEIQDVIVDLRKDSPSYKQYISIVLNADDKKQIYIPKGCAHAFLTLSNQAIVSYKVDNYYSKSHDAGIKYDDPTLNIQWQLDKKDIILSDKDNLLPYI